MIKDADKYKVSISILGQPANTSLPSPVQDLGLEEDGGDTHWLGVRKSDCKGVTA